MLEDLGHTVTAAATGEEALTILKADHAFDLTITDYAMPGVTGLELAKRIRAEWPDIPLLLASGRAELQDEPDADIPRLAKPLRRDDVGSIIPHNRLEAHFDAQGPEFICNQQRITVGPTSQQKLRANCYNFSDDVLMRRMCSTHGHAETGCSKWSPARPQRAQRRVVTFLTRPPRAAGAAPHPGPYVEPLSDARTKLAAIWDILLT